MCNLRFRLIEKKILAIEINPRYLSRSSALASKATGYPYCKDRF
jgi:carbamoylphosphate synthase large subunit